MWGSKWTKLAANPRETKGGGSSQKSHKDVWGVGILSSRGDKKRKKVYGGLLGRRNHVWFGKCPHYK